MAEASGYTNSSPADGKRAFKALQIEAISTRKLKHNTRDCLKVTPLCMQKIWYIVVKTPSVSDG